MLQRSDFLVAFSQKRNRDCMKWMEIEDEVQRVLDCIPFGDGKSFAGCDWLIIRTVLYGTTTYVWSVPLSLALPMFFFVKKRIV